MSSIDAVKVTAPKSSKTAPVLPRTNQPSRKGTKAWRRNVDITEEEGALRELGERQRLGVADLHERPDDELFHTVTNPDIQARNREFGRLKVRVKDILQPKSGYPGITTRPHLKEVTKSTRKFSVAELNRIDRVVDRLNRKKLKTTPSCKKPDSSIWEDQLPPEALPLSFVEEPAQLTVPKTMRNIPKAKVVMPAVKVAGPGASYNPRFQDHQALIQEAIEEENAENAKYRAIIAQLPSRTGPEDGGAMLVDETGYDEEDGVAFVAPNTRKLTRAERNRQARRKVQESVTRRNKLEKKLRLQMPSVSTMYTEVTNTEAEREAASHQRRKRFAARQVLPLRMSNYRFQPTRKAMEVQLTEDLAGSLLKLVPEGSLARDRFKSLQERNIIETRVPTTQKRKYALKIYQKRDYREFE